VGPMTALDPTMPDAATGPGVEAVTVRFAGVKALDRVSLWVEPTSIHAIIGPNGAGKSILFNVVSGVYTPAAGSVRFAGHELVGRRPHEVAGLGVARAFQNVALYPHSTVEENILLGRHHLTRAGFVACGAAAPVGPPRGASSSGPGGGDRRVPRPRASARRAGRRAVPRRSEAGRHRPGPVRRTVVAAPRRAGRGATSTSKVTTARTRWPARSTPPTSSAWRSLPRRSSPPTPTSPPR